MKSIEFFNFSVEIATFYLGKVDIFDFLDPLGVPDDHRNFLGQKKTSKNLEFLMFFFDSRVRGQQS